MGLWKKGDLPKGVGPQEEEDWKAVQKEMNYRNLVEQKKLFEETYRRADRIHDAPPPPGEGHLFKHLADRVDPEVLVILRANAAEILNLRDNLEAVMERMNRLVTDAADSSSLLSQAVNKAHVAEVELEMYREQIQVLSMRVEELEQELYGDA